MDPGNKSNFINRVNSDIVLKIAEKSVSDKENDDTSLQQINGKKPHVSLMSKAPTRVILAELKRKQPEPSAAVAVAVAPAAPKLNIVASQIQSESERAKEDKENVPNGPLAKRICLPPPACIPITATVQASLLNLFSLMIQEHQSSPPQAKCKKNTSKKMVQNSSILSAAVAVEKYTRNGHYIVDVEKCQLFDHTSGYVLSVCTNTAANAAKDMPILDFRGIWDQMPSGNSEVRKVGENFLRGAVRIALYIVGNNFGATEIILHCRNGRSRSPAVVMAFFVLFRGMTQQDVDRWFQIVFPSQRPETAKCSAPGIFPNTAKFANAIEFLSEHRNSESTRASVIENIELCQREGLIPDTLTVDDVKATLLAWLAAPQSLAIVPPDCDRRLKPTSFFFRAGMCALETGPLTSVDRNALVSTKPITRSQRVAYDNGAKDLYPCIKIESNIDVENSTNALAAPTADLLTVEPTPLVSTNSTRVASDNDAKEFFLKIGFKEPFSREQRVGFNNLPMFFCAGTWCRTDMLNWLFDNKLCTLSDLKKQFWKKRTLLYWVVGPHYSGNLKVIRWMYSKIGDANFGILNLR